MTGLKKEKGGKKKKKQGIWRRETVKIKEGKKMRAAIDGSASLKNALMCPLLCAFCLCGCVHVRGRV